MHIKASAGLLLCFIITLFTACEEADIRNIKPLTGPNITIISPSQDQGVVGFNKNTTIKLKGIIEDEKGIDKVRVNMISQITNEDLDPDDDADGVVYAEYNLDQEINIPETARSGEYALIVQATDFDGNTGKYTVYVRIL